MALDQPPKQHRGLRRAIEGEGIELLFEENGAAAEIASQALALTRLCCPVSV
jgi:hypothetical protein